MSINTGARKFTGSAAKLTDYYKQESDEPSLEQVVSYYGTPKSDVVFSHIAGKAIAHLPGLDPAVGLTREQHFELHNGRWGGKQLVRGNYSPVWQLDEDGHVLKKVNPKTRKLENVPVMVKQWIDEEAGIPLLDADTGKQVEKMLTKPASTSGIDIRFSLDKSWAEFLVAHPEHTELVKKNFRKAVDTSMRVAVEEHCNLIVSKKGGVKTVSKAEGLIWFSVIGMASRPTHQAIERNYEVDPHLHCHTMLSSMAYVGNGEWRKIDSKEIFRTAEFRGHVASVELNRLMEIEGLRVEYADIDRKGRVQSNIAGSSKAVRRFFSTQSDRAWELRMVFERKWKRPPDHNELDAIMGATKARKTKHAKEADEIGNLDQIDLWREALKAEGIELTVENLGSIPVVHNPKRNRRILFERLERPDGVARDIENAPVFGPEVVLPAAFRMAEGLGFSPTEIADLADLYRDTELVELRPAVDPANRLYTTKSILAAEQSVAELLELKAARTVKAVSEVDLIAVLRSQPIRLDQEQLALVRAGAGTDPIVHVEGQAGSGKTAALTPMVQALRRSGTVKEVVVLAVARNRADETGADVAADKSWSVEALKVAAAHGWKSKGDKTLVIIDEAAMVNTFEMRDVLERIGDARLVSVGDTMQASAIGAAGHYERELDARPPIQLKNNYRQKHWQDRVAWELLRQGDAHGALDNLYKRGRIFVADDPQRLITEVQERYEHYRDKGYGADKIAIINTGRNTTLDSLNRMVQRVRLDKHEISEWATFDVIDSSSGRRWRLHEGDRIIFNRGTYDVSPPIRNGKKGTIVELLPDGTCKLELDDKRTVTLQLEPEELIQPVAPAYCMSTNKFQGSEVAINFTVPGSPGIASRNSGYATVTRNTEITEVFLDRETWGEHPVHGLGEAWTHEVVKEMASSYQHLAAVPVEDVLEHDDDLDLTVPAEAVDRIQQAREALDHGGLNM